MPRYLRTAVHQERSHRRTAQRRSMPMCGWSPDLLVPVLVQTSRSTVWSPPRSLANRGPISTPLNDTSDSTYQVAASLQTCRGKAYSIEKKSSDAPLRHVYEAMHRDPRFRRLDRAPGVRYPPIHVSAMIPLPDCLASAAVDASKVALLVQSRGAIAD